MRVLTTILGRAGDEGELLPRHSLLPVWYSEGDQGEEESSPFTLEREGKSDGHEGQRVARVLTSILKRKGRSEGDEVESPHHSL